MRVITTGWRDWDKSALNVDRLFAFMDALLDMTLMSNEKVLQLAHGDAPGADHLVQEWWEAQCSAGLIDPSYLPEPQRFPAKWSQYGSPAGPLRNAEMVIAGADLCVGFLHPALSRGTWDCLTKARRAKIFCLTLEWEHDPKYPVEVLGEQLAA